MQYLTSSRAEQQIYRNCMGLLKLAEKHSPSKLEDACSRIFCSQFRESEWY